MNELRGGRTYTDTQRHADTKKLCCELRQADRGARRVVCSAMNSCQTHSVGEAQLQSIWHFSPFTDGRRANECCIFCSTTYILSGLLL